MGDSFVQTVDLGAMEQQLAPTVGVVGRDARGELVWGDVDALQPQLAAVVAGESVGELDLTAAQALHLAAVEDDAGFDRVEHAVVVAGAAVPSDQLRTGTVDVLACGGHGAIDDICRADGAWPTVGRRYGAGVLALPRDVIDAAAAAAYDAYPYECCGLLAAAAGDHTVARFYRCRNVAESARVYTVDPLDHLQAERDSESNGWEIVGVVHSHTHTEPYPSATDIAQAPDPGWHYVIVGLARESPEIRSYRIADGGVAEEPLAAV